MKISIEGNIGCGKSTILSRLCLEHRLPVFLEPINEWNEWLTLFYKDPTKWGMSFAIRVLLSFNKWIDNNFTAFYERSPLANRFVFSEIQYEKKQISELEWQLYSDIYDKLSWVPDIIIYIKTDPEKCMERMQQRNRKCEDNVPLDYLTKVHEKYEKMFDTGFILKNIYTNGKKCRFIIIDGNRNHDEVYQDVCKIVDEVY